MVQLPLSQQAGESALQPSSLQLQGPLVGRGDELVVITTWVVVGTRMLGVVSIVLGSPLELELRTTLALDQLIVLEGLLEPWAMEL